MSFISSCKWCRCGFHSATPSHSSGKKLDTRYAVLRVAMYNISLGISFAQNPLARHHRTQAFLSLWLDAICLQVQHLTEIFCCVVLSFYERLAGLLSTGISPEPMLYQVQWVNGIFGGWLIGSDASGCSQTNKVPTTSAVSFTACSIMCYIILINAYVHKQCTCT